MDRMNLGTLLMLLVNVMDRHGPDVEIAIGESSDPKLKLISYKILGLNGPNKRIDDSTVFSLVPETWATVDNSPPSITAEFDKPKAYDDEELVVKVARILMNTMGEDVLRLHAFFDGAIRGYDTFHDVLGSMMMEKYPEIFAADLKTPKGEYEEVQPAGDAFEQDVIDEHNRNEEERQQWIDHSLNTTKVGAPVLDDGAIDLSNLEAHGASIPHDDSDVPLPNGVVVRRAYNNTDED